MAFKAIGIVAHQGPIPPWEAGKEYPIKVQFDRSPIWDATATARDIGTSMLLVATTTDTNFVAEFAKKLTVRAEFNGRQIAKLRLDRSAKAITAMLDCQRAVNEVTAKSAPSPSQSDPFEQTPKSEAKSSLIYSESLGLRFQTSAVTMLSSSPKRGSAASLPILFANSH
ncbi:hypothetical protein [Rhizobium phaseoli]|uniref:hypothetical protein n=1 Tax=Rhizobium phaseoli TaxID=396 RepID=UPI000B1D1EC3|nr:hypothetical protein [Rhizobium phaseoli]